jgi:hypothetical protein
MATGNTANLNLIGATHIVSTKGIPDEAAYIYLTGEEHDLETALDALQPVLPLGASASMGEVYRLRDKLYRRPLLTPCHGDVEDQRAQMEVMAGFTHSPVDDYEKIPVLIVKQEEAYLTNYKPYHERGGKKEYTRNVNDAALGAAALIRWTQERLGYPIPLQTVDGFTNTELHAEMPTPGVIVKSAGLNSDGLSAVNALVHQLILEDGRYITDSHYLQNGFALEGIRLLSRDPSPGPEAAAIRAKQMANEIKQILGKNGLKPRITHTTPEFPP